jgi:hypothetical protein
MGQRGKRSRRIVHATVIFAAAILSIMIVLGTIDNQFFSYTQVYGDVIANPLNPKEQLFIEVKLRSTTFSANTPMPAEVFLFLNGNDRNWSDYTTNAPKSYYVLFKDSLCGGTEPGKLPYRCTIDLAHSANGGILYYNTTTLTYSHGGEFDVILSAEGHSIDQSVGHGFISIAPTQALHDYRTFKITLIIGIIAAVFAGLSLYEQTKEKHAPSSS